jgi:uncharacterized protein (TIGR02594 family)
MRQLFASCRPLRFIALALCSASIFVFVAPASARPYHGTGRHARAYHAGHHAKWHHTHRHFRHAARVSNRDRSAAKMQARGLANGYASFTPNPVDAAPSGAIGSPDIVIGSRPRYRQQTQRPRQLRRAARASNWDRGVAKMQAGGFADTNASIPPNASVDPNSTLTPPGGVMAAGFDSFSSNVVAEARRYLGGNPTDRRSLWCARFMNMVLQHTGYRGTGSDMASSFASYGQRVSGPQVGAIAVMTRGRRGGHVGVITGIDAKGNPIMISGNNGNRVREAPVSRGRIYAYVMPTS